MDRTMESLRKNIRGSWKGTGKNGSQFFQRRNLEGGVMLEFKIVNSNYFISSFLI